MKRLNIFVDETGEFGFSKGSSRFYGVSFVFHEQNNQHLDYFHSFSKIVIYYDGGQKPLNKIIKNELLVFNNSIQVPDFDHIDKKLFQVADMLTYVDKLAFKYNKRIKMSNTEKMFCSQKTLRTILKELKSKRF